MSATTTSFFRVKISLKTMEKAASLQLTLESMEKAANYLQETFGAGNACVSAITVLPVLPKQDAPLIDNFFFF